MITKLTDEQKSKKDIWRQMYLDKFFNNKKVASKDEVKSYMHWFYSNFKISKTKKPKVFLFDSPLELLIGIELFKIKTLKVSNEVRNEVWNEVSNEVSNEVENEVRNEVWNEVSNEVSNEVENEVRNEVWNEVSNEVSNEVRSEVSSEVWNEVWNEVSNEVWNEVWNEVGNEVRKFKKIKWYQQSYYLSSFNSWVSFYDFFDKNVFKLKKSKLFNDYKRVLDLNIFWSVPFGNAVFVSRNAIKYLRDERKRLHSTKEAAVQFGGKFNYSLYFIHGVCISKETFLKIKNKSYSFENFLKEKNEEIKSACLSFIEEEFGSEYLFRFLSSNLKEIDNYVDKKEDKYLEGTTKGMNIGVYTLFKGDINNIKLAFVRCYCPSTDRMFFLSVSSDNNNAKDAIASLYRVPRLLKNKIKYIQRQGERFSTVFNEEIPELSKKELEDLVSLTGNEYFKLMTYEY